MKKLLLRFDADLSWKSWSAISLFICGLVGLLSGVDVSERPGLPEADVFTKAYYTLGLFVLGGLDLGTPTGGPVWGRFLLWIAYFGAPIWTASAIFETILNALRPPVWHVRRIKRKIVIFGGGELTLAFLHKVAASGNPRQVIVVVDDSQHVEIDELRSFRGIRVFAASGQQVRRLRRYPLHTAQKFLLLSDNDALNLEVASFLLRSNPQLGPKIVFHLSDLRFLRVMSESRVVRKCTTFNQYELAATQLAREWLIKRFNETEHRDSVVLAGFGRFGQSILEQLERHASGEFSRVAIIDLQAQQRALIADEQVATERQYERFTYEGDIDDPEIWQHLFKDVVLDHEEPVFVITTGNDQTNLRCAIWLRQRFKNALIIARTMAPSFFAKGVCAEHNIVSVNTADLVELSIPHAWYR